MRFQVVQQRTMERHREGEVSWWTVWDTMERKFLDDADDMFIERISGVEIDPDAHARAQTRADLLNAR